MAVPWINPGFIGQAVEKFCRHITQERRKAGGILLGIANTAGE
jgi:hypothetical protein